MRQSLGPVCRKRASLEIAEHVRAFACERGAKSVFVYVSLGNEVDTHGLIQRWLHDGVRVFVPAFDEAGAMHAAPLLEWAALRPGSPASFGVPTAPLRNPASPEPEIDLVLVPCLAVDDTGVRLGQGGGHYDRWLAGRTKASTLALAFACQIVDAVPAEAHDRAVNAVATEVGVTAFDSD